MQLATVLLQSVALLSRVYLGILIGLASWAIIPLAIGWTPTVVMSGSMLPNIEVGDVVIAQNTTEEKKKDIRVGQVLLAKDPLHSDNLFTHRVVNIIEDVGFITKGDANAKADITTTPISHVLGIERLRVPMIGIPIHATRTGDITTLAIFIIATVTAHFIVMKDNAINSPSPTNGSETKRGRRAQKPSIKNSLARENKQGRRKSDAERKPKLAQRALLVIAYSSAIVLISTSSSSAASFSGSSGNSNNNFSSVKDFSKIYSNGIIEEQPLFYYRLNELLCLIGADDSSGNNRGGIYSLLGASCGTSSALKRDTSNKAITTGILGGTVTPSASTSGLHSLTLQLWIKTTSNSGGKLIGFTTGATLLNNKADRILYMTNSGKINFGVDEATKKTIHSSASYNDGKWHMVTATLSESIAKLYVDGKLVASDSITTKPSTASGYWVTGGGGFSGWPSQPSNTNFSGSFDEISVFEKVLSSYRISTLYAAS